jgi:hypothetical protein
MVDIIIIQWWNLNTLIKTTYISCLCFNHENQCEVPYYIKTSFIKYGWIVVVHKFQTATWSIGSRGSSVRMVSCCGLDDRAMKFTFSVDANYFSPSLCVQTGSGAHPASCTMGTGGPFPGAKARLGVTLTTLPHLVPRSRMSRSYTSSPLKRLQGV